MVLHYRKQKLAVFFFKSSPYSAHDFRNTIKVFSFPRLFNETQMFCYWNRANDFLSIGVFFLRSFVSFCSVFLSFSAFDWLGKEIVQSRVRKKLVWLPPRWRSQHNTQNGREPPSTKTNNNNENIRERFFLFSPTTPAQAAHTQHTTRKEGRMK